MKVKQLYTYPIKSLRPCPLQSTPLTPTGFPYDRRFMLLKVHPDGTRQNMLVAKFNEMVLFAQELRRSGAATPSCGSEDGGQGPEYDEVVVRYAPPTRVPEGFQGAREGAEMAIPLRPDVERMRLQRVDVVLHRSGTAAWDMGESYNGWFTRCFGYEVMLVYLGMSTRKVLGNLAPEVANSERTTGGQEAREQGDMTMEQAGGWWNQLTHIAGSVGSTGGGIIASMANMVGVPENRVAGGSMEAGDGKAEEEADRPETRITFADCSAYLVVTTESLADVSSRLPEGDEMDITKFRPNIVLSGAQGAWDEDWWESVEFLSSPNAAQEDGEEKGLEAEVEGKEQPAKLLLTANCARCVSINVDYETGRQGKGEAGSMLKKLMVDRRVDKGNRWSPVFGRYGFLDASSGGYEVKKGRWPMVRVGDQVAVGGRRAERRVWEWPGMGSNSSRAAP